MGRKIRGHRLVLCFEKVFHVLECEDFSKFFEKIPKPKFFKEK